MTYFPKRVKQTLFVRVDNLISDRIFALEGSTSIWKRVLLFTAQDVLRSIEKDWREARVGFSTECKHPTGTLDQQRGVFFCNHCGLEIGKKAHLYQDLDGEFPHLISRVI